MSKIYIAIPVHNRGHVAAQCVPTVGAAMRNGDILHLYNDCSTEFSTDFVRALWRGTVVHECDHEGTEGQRRIHLADFLASDCERLYFTDPDALHDPDALSTLERLQDMWERPICGFNTSAHADVPGNTISQHGEIILRHYAPGISYLLTRAMVEKVDRACRALGTQLTAHDWQIPAFLGYRFAVTKTSVVDHVGHGGIRHPVDAGFDGGDRALNPTPYLVAKRAEVVAKLKALHESA